MSYPVNINVKGKIVIVAGGGSVARRKITGLLEVGAIVKVVAPDFDPEIEMLEAEGRVSLRRGSFRPEDLDGAFLAFAATDDQSVNESLSKEAERRGILVNVADQPDLCTFTLPAVVRRGDLTISIATDGACPAFAGTLREELEGLYGAGYVDSLEFFSRLRKKLIDAGWDSPRIKQAIRQLYMDGIGEFISAGREKDIRVLLELELGSDDFFPGLISEK